jgi:CheY-like chemotaxis protein
MWAFKTQVQNLRAEMLKLPNDRRCQGAFERLSTVEIPEVWPDPCYSIIIGRRDNLVLEDNVGQPGTLETILIVEDDPAIRKLVETILGDGGFEILGADSAKEAISVEASFPRTIHLLLSDVMMPDMGGPDLAAKLKLRRPEMRVMLMSGYADGAMLVLNHGWHFIRKPFLPAALLGKVTEILHTTVRDQGTDHFDPSQVSRK